jgi:hypothetical protein
MHNRYLIDCRQGDLGKYKKDINGLFVDELDRHHRDNPLLGFVGSELWPIRQSWYYVPTVRNLNKSDKY